MQLMAILFLAAIWSPHSGGIGRNTIKVSMSMFKLTEVSSSIAKALQCPPGTGFQEYEIGWQFVRKTQRNEIP